MFMKNIFHGRLTKDIELKKTNSGISVCRFQLACDRYAGSKKGTITEYPSFVAWRVSLNVWPITRRKEASC